MAVLAALAAGGACTPDAPGGVAFEDPWIRAPVGSQTTTAGYCRIVNGSERDVEVTGFADAGGALRIEIHETREQGGMVRMRPLPKLTVAAGQTLSLRPGGKHLMLFGMDARVSAVDVRALFADGGAQVVRFRVRPAVDSGSGR